RSPSPPHTSKPTPPPTTTRSPDVCTTCSPRTTSITRPSNSVHPAKAVTLTSPPTIIADRQTLDPLDHTPHVDGSYRRTSERKRKGSHRPVWRAHRSSRGLRLVVVPD